MLLPESILIWYSPFLTYKVRIKTVPTEKEEIKLSLIAHNMVLYVGNPKNSTEKTCSDKHIQQSFRIQSQCTKIRRASAR